MSRVREMEFHWCHAMACTGMWMGDGNGMIHGERKGGINYTYATTSGSKMGNQVIAFRA